MRLLIEGKRGSQVFCIVFELFQFSFSPVHVLPSPEPVLLTPLLGYGSVIPGEKSLCALEQGLRHSGLA